MKLSRQHAHSNCRRLGPGYSLVLCLRITTVALLGAPVLVAADIPDADDPGGIPRFPRSTIIEYSKREEHLPYDLVIAPVEKSRREVRIKDVVRVTGPLTRVTYQTPDGTQPQEVFEHYLKLARVSGQTPVYTCQGRACGRSAAWANEVFGVPILAASNDNQFYASVPFQLGGVQRLAAIYVVQRGTRRVYAHIDVVEPDTEVTFDLNFNIAEDLARNGFAVIQGVRPDRSGMLQPKDLATLGAIGTMLSTLIGQELYVVCHLFGARAATELIQLSNDCAQQAADAIATTSEVAPTPFGGGPLLARRAESRIELVLPQRLRRD